MSKNNQQLGYDFGSFSGVFMPSILTILGVVMYLRFGWVLGQVGLAGTLLIVTLATTITLLTALSISELATNMRIGGGGAYYLISRSFGMEAGAAIGIPLFFAQALGISFYVAGFSESIHNLFPIFDPLWIGIITLVALTVTAAVSAQIAIRIQFFIFGLIVMSLLSFFTGHPLVEADTVEPVAVFSSLSFWAVFSVFFPAVTGIEAGLSMSGDLKDPARSLPRGTLMAVGVSYVIYLLIPIFLHQLDIPRVQLLSDPMIFKKVARFGSLIVAGLWGASLSSALGAILGSPRTLQAMARDGIVPAWIGRGYGKNNDPRFAALISFMVALAGVCLGNLNIIAPILSMFFLTSYGLLNFSAGLEGFLSNPSFRPTFRVHWGFSMFGALACVMVMFMINAGATFVALGFSAGMYYVMKRRRLKASWGDLRFGLWSWVSRLALYKLNHIKPHQKTWRPNLLVLSGSPNARWYLIELADAISHGKGFLTVAVLWNQESEDSDKISNLAKSVDEYLKKRQVEAFVKISKVDEPLIGAQELIRNYGFGPLLPNTILLGETERPDQYERFASLVITSYRLRRNMLIVREAHNQPTMDITRRIDLWWRRIGDNSGLMLALAYLLKTSPEWEGAQLVIKTIVENPDEQIKQSQALKEFIEAENMEAEFDVLLRRDDEDPFAMILRSSETASMMFLGLRAPGVEESTKDYSQYYQKFVQQTQDGPAKVLVLAAEDVDFNGIFEFRQA